MNNAPLVLKSIPGPLLLERTRTLAADERRIGVEILHYLREVRARRLHLELGYSSLFSFCVEELKYSEASAYQKIQALKLMDDVPEVEGKLEAGTLTVSNAAQIQSFSQAAKKRGLPAPTKGELVGRIENRSKRDAARILADLSPVPMIEERIRPVGGECTEIRFVASERLMRKFERLQALRSHVNANPTMAELLEDLADLALKKLDPVIEGTGSEVGVPTPERLRPGKVPTQKAATQRAPSQAAVRARKAIPAALRREIWTRDKGRCVYRNPQSGRQCESRHLIQIDHRIPKALGGADALENLRLHCAGHNRLAAIRVFGVEKMAAFISE